MKLKALELFFYFWPNQHKYPFPKYRIKWAWNGKEHRCVLTCNATLPARWRHDDDDDWRTCFSVRFDHLLCLEIQLSLQWNPRFYFCKSVKSIYDSLAIWKYWFKCLAQARSGRNFSLIAAKCSFCLPQQVRAFALVTSPVQWLTCKQSHHVGIWVQTRYGIMDGFHNLYSKGVWVILRH